MIRVAIVAESPVTKAGLEAMLGRDGRFIILESITSDPSADLGEIDVLVVVMEGPEIPPLDNDGGPAVVVIADVLDPLVASRLLRDGARGVLPREATADQIDAAIAAAAAGLVTVSPELSGAATAARSPSSTALQPLTPREGEVLNLIARGLGNKVVAARLAISEHTVKSHVESIFEKLEVSSRAEAVARGIQFGIVFV